MNWLGLSVALSIVLTVVLNVGLRLFPDVRRRVARAMTESTWPGADEARSRNRRVRLWFPWKAMILGSLLLTVLVNLVLWITRT